MQGQMGATGGMDPTGGIANFGQLSAQMQGEITAEAFFPLRFSTSMNYYEINLRMSKNHLNEYLYQK